MKKLMSPAVHQPTFAPADILLPTLVESFLPSKMSSSKPTLASLQTQITELQAQHAALLARVESILAAPAAPAADAEAPAKKGKRGGAKKEKKPRDPDAPKRAPTAFFAFSAAERAKPRDADAPKLTAKVCAERWALLTDEQKAAFKPATPVASDAE